MIVPKNKKSTGIKAWFQNKIVMTTTFIGFLSVLCGAVIAVESRYAHADDVKAILKNQQTQIDLYRQHQTENQLFQLEYYNTRIARLEDERRRSVVLTADPRTPQSIRTITRTPQEIDIEIHDLKTRKDYLEKTIKR